MKQVVEKRKDIAFYLLMYAPAHPAAREALQYTLCGKTNSERLERFEIAAKKGKIPKAECDKSSVIDSIANFARAHMINGTPGLFMQNGTAVKGSVKTMDDLINRIDADTKKK